MRYIIGVFGILVILILIAVAIFRNSPSDTDKNQETNQQVVLTDYSDTPAVVQYTTYGNVTGEEQRRSINISVSKEQRVLEILEGYEGRVTSRQAYTNNQSAFSVFLSSLQNAGFTNVKQPQVSLESGACPLGTSYVYLLQNGSEQVHRSWSTSCSARQGSFAGNSSTIRKLFQLQIPEYKDQVQDVDL